MFYIVVFIVYLSGKINMLWENFGNEDNDNFDYDKKNWVV